MDADHDLAGRSDVVVIESVAPSATVQADLGLLAWIRPNAHACIAGAIYACALLVASAHEFVQDSWLSIVGEVGRA